MSPVATSDAAFRGGACPTPEYTVTYTGNYTTSADASAATVGYQAGRCIARRVQGPEGQGEEDTELGKVALTRDFKETVKERAARDPAFAKAMLDEAATAFLNGEPHVARLILRDLVNASVGFEGLATETNRPSKSLHRMLSEKGNPSMDNLAAIFGVVRRHLGVTLEANSVEPA